MFKSSAYRRHSEDRQNLTTLMKMMKSRGHGPCVTGTTNFEFLRSTRRLKCCKKSEPMINIFVSAIVKTHVKRRRKTTSSVRRVVP